MPNLQLLAAWIAVASALISIGHNVDQWMDDDTRDKFGRTIRTQFAAGPVAWSTAVNRAFLAFFDVVYRRRWQIERALWQSILFAYAILAEARLVLLIFEIPIPETSAMLGVALVVAIGGTLFVQAFAAGGALFVRHEREQLDAAGLVRTAEFRSVILYGSLAMFIYTGAAMWTGFGLGFAVKNIVAVALGSAIGVPTMMAITLIPDRWLPVSPITAIVSSLLSLFVLSAWFRDESGQFLAALGRDQWKALCLLLFNLFADLISLLETRWLLAVSARSLTVGGMLLALFLDLVLNAVIFLVLPGIVDQQLDVLLQGILFAGPAPWTGILFWSTFATSFLFYLFVLAVVLLKALSPLLKGLNAADQVLHLYDHPARLVAVMMVAICSVGFAFAL
jgi:hypothetical protein